MQSFRSNTFAPNTFACGAWRGTGIVIVVPVRRDVLAVGLAWLGTQLRQHASRDVVYGRGVQQVTLAATIGKTLFEVDDGHGILERWEARDFLVAAADLVVGTATLPQKGDRIHETDGLTTFVYEVMAPSREPVYRFSDPYRKTLRIHTKQVGTE